MRRSLVAIAALALAVVFTPAALAEKPEKLTHVKLLAFNDFHGHLEATRRARSSAPSTAQPSPPAAPSTSPRI